jgi:hypothetical protein
VFVEFRRQLNTSNVGAASLRRRPLEETRDCFLGFVEENKDHAIGAIPLSPAGAARHGQETSMPAS